MTAREFLQQIIEALPSRGLDSTDIYILSELDSYKIVSISNDGSNDGLFITIEKI